MTIISASSHIVGRLTLDNRNSIALYEVTLPFTIGRSSDCDLTIPDSHVSRHHCEITRVGGVLCITDTSANGTFVADRRLASESMAVEQTVNINLGGAIRIRLTPEDTKKDRRRGDRRDGEERRCGERREKTITGPSENVVKFERRVAERRDPGDRREQEDRRASDRRRVARG